MMFVWLSLWYSCRVCFMGLYWIFRLDCLMLANRLFLTRSQNSQYRRKTFPFVPLSLMKQGLMSPMSGSNGSANRSNPKARFVTPILIDGFKAYLYVDLKWLGITCYFKFTRQCFLWEKNPQNPNASCIVEIFIKQFRPAIVLQISWFEILNFRCNIKDL